MGLTDSLVTYAQYLYNLLNDNKDELGLELVFYGDQTKLGATPAVCVDPNLKTREISGAPRRTAVELSAFIIVYHSKVQDNQTTRVETDKYSETVESFIHQNAQMGGLVIHSLVSRMESGYLTRSNVQYRTTRLTVDATSQIQLPYSVT